MFVLRNQIKTNYFSNVFEYCTYMKEWDGTWELMVHPGSKGNAKYVEEMDLLYSLIPHLHQNNIKIINYNQL